MARGGFVQGAGPQVPPVPMGDELTASGQAPSWELSGERGRTMLHFVRTSVKPLGAAPSAAAEMLRRIELAAGIPLGMAKDFAARAVNALWERRRITAMEHSNIVLKVLSTHFEMDFFSKVDGRIWLHRLHTTGGHTYLAGNLRAWLESCRHMELRGGFNWPEIPTFLHETFPTIFPKVPVSPEYRLYNLELVAPEEQLSIARADPLADLPVFSFQITCDEGVGAEIPRYRSLSVTIQDAPCTDGSGKVSFILPEEWEYCYDESGERVDLDRMKETDAALYEHCRGSAELHARICDAGTSPHLARDILPRLSGTRMIVSGPLSAWRHFIAQRHQPGTHPRMRYIAQSVRSWFEYIGLRAH